MIIKVIDSKSKLEKDKDSITSNDLVFCKCDLCLIEYKRVYRPKYTSTDKCRKCKLKETCFPKYGVEYPTQSEAVQEKIKQTCLIRYKVEHPAQSEIVKNKYRQTCSNKYGVDNPSKLKIIKEKMKSTNLKRYGVENAAKSEVIKKKSRVTCLKKYRVDCPFKSRTVKNKIKQTCQERYGVENVAQDPEIIQKVLNTKRKNHTFNTSKSEERVYDYLVKKYPNVLRQYNNDSRYPFLCDFYILEKDLFIECNFSWLHGKPYKEPFEKNKAEHIKTLNEWIKRSVDHPLYKSAITTWTIRDPLKRETAQQNNLNYLEFFSEKDLYSLL